MKVLRIMIPACIGRLANSGKRRAATMNRSRFHIGSRTLLIITAGLWLISANAYAQNRGPSHFRDRLNQQVVSPFEFYGFGAPFPRLATNSADLTNFNNGLLNFQEVETLNSATAASGPPGQLGPLFNNTSCAACHSQSGSWWRRPDAHGAEAVNGRTTGKDFRGRSYVVWRSITAGRRCDDFSIRTNRTAARRANQHS